MPYDDYHDHRLADIDYHDDANDDLDYLAAYLNNLTGEHDLHYGLIYKRCLQYVGAYDKQHGTDDDVPGLRTDDFKRATGYYPPDVAADNDPAAFELVYNYVIASARYKHNGGADIYRALDAAYNALIDHDRNRTR
jgi:hypothetical protein